MKRFGLIILMTMAVASGVAAQAVTIETVPVGNPGNAGELSGASVPGGFGPDRVCGAVGYSYKIGKHEVTAGQYTEFLNAVAADDTHGLYNSSMWSSSYGCKIEQTGSSGSYSYCVAADWAERPVNYVSWGDAARFANWLDNGRPTGAQDLSTSEDGAYYLNGATSDAALLAVTREPDATWVIPSEDEWYKAAYHKNDGATGHYFDYPTSTDSRPSNDLVDPDPGNNATFGFGENGDYTIGSPYWRTQVGAHENSESPYGTFDQGGNVCEWNEAVIGSHRGLRGGSWTRSDHSPRGGGLLAADRYYHYPSLESMTIGFRVSQRYTPRVALLEVFYEGRFGNAADLVKEFLAVGQASHMSLVGDHVHGNVTNYLNGITGIRVTFDRVVTFASDVSAAFSYEATPEQQDNKVFSAFAPPTSPIYVVDDGTGKTVVTIIFMDGEIKNRWLKIIVDASQVVSAENGLNLDGELTSPLTLPSGDGTAGGNAEFIIGNRVGDVDCNYRCLLNDAVGVRYRASSALVGISNAYDIDKSGRVLLNDAILARNNVSGIALPALP